ncbi:hypothetical protein [Nocardioides acrostichi]|uniref:Lipoprotein n=1 Tax=Nocardioides acrostichi TaxID=2784339 RepID=A0A930V0X9_9ACTN|nr:hypothetical protein [Nocardioides acrostichi]MBF4163691.1 hypothetical protein [Nocardioides acrostichi]
MALSALRVRVAGLIVLLAGVTGCGAGEAQVSTGTGVAAGSPRALAAAFIAHYGEDPATVEPMPPDAVDLNESAMGVVLEFRERGGPRTYVRVIVSRHPFDVAERACSDDQCDDVGSGGAQAMLIWSVGTPEEDPGVVTAEAHRGEVYVLIRSDGPFVPAGHDTPEVERLADAVVATANDPAVGFTTSRTYAEAGRALPDDVWRATR